MCPGLTDKAQHSAGLLVFLLDKEQTELDVGYKRKLVEINHSAAPNHHAVLTYIGLKTLLF